MRRDDHFPCNFIKACYAMWCVKVAGWSMTKTAFRLEVSEGTISHIINGHRFKGAYPIPLPGFEDAA